MNNIIELNEKFYRIKKMGYIKGVCGGSRAIGRTFEDLLGKKEDRLSLPDYKGIEIKCHRVYSKAPIALFNATFNNLNKDINSFVKNYGIQDKDTGKNIFIGSVNAIETTKIGKFFRFKLQVDRKKKRVYMLVIDRLNNVIDNTFYWDLNILKARLEQKLSILAVIDVWTKKINDIEYYNYSKINYYRLKSFDNFVEALELGIIDVYFTYSVIRSGVKKGMISDHGTSFKIKVSLIECLFSKVSVNELN